MELKELFLDTLEAHVLISSWSSAIYSKATLELQGEREKWVKYVWEPVTAMGWTDA